MDNEQFKSIDFFNGTDYTYFGHDVTDEQIERVNTHLASSDDIIKFDEILEKIDRYIGLTNHENSSNISNLEEYEKIISKLIDYVLDNKEGIKEIAEELKKFNSFRNNKNKEFELSMKNPLKEAAFSIKYRIKEIRDGDYFYSIEKNKSPFFDDINEFKKLGGKLEDLGLTVQFISDLYTIGVKMKLVKLIEDEEIDKYLYLKYLSEIL